MQEALSSVSAAQIVPGPVLRTERETLSAAQGPPTVGSVKADTRRRAEEAALQRFEFLHLLTFDQKKILLSELFEDVFGSYYRTMLKWRSLTGQPAQPDTGYLGQHIASIILGVPGLGFKGKGDDLIDQTEVKTASDVGGSDTARWNHNVIGGDVSKRKNRPDDTLNAKKLTAAENLFYLLFDHPSGDEGVIRARAWCVQPKRDEAWRDAVWAWVKEWRKGKQYNFQLQTPTGTDSNIARNTTGSLDMTDVKVMDVRFDLPSSSHDPLELDWVMTPSDAFMHGTTRPVPYVRPPRGEKATSLRAESVAAPSADELRALFPGIF